MNEHQRWFWRMDSGQRHETQGTYAADTFWDNMIADFKKNVPVQFTELQRKCALDAAEEIIKMRAERAAELAAARESTKGAGTDG